MRPAPNHQGQRKRGGGGKVTVCIHAIFRCREKKKRGEPEKYGRSAFGQGGGRGREGSYALRLKKVKGEGRGMW